MAYSDTQETAWSFDLLCALWVLSSILGHGVQVARGSDRLALNLYILLVAPSGVARKSTALGLAARLWDRCRPPSSITISQRLSPERLNEKLAISPHCAFVASELVSLLGRAGYSHLLPSLLTDVYDCHTSVYPTFLAASTPTWLAKSLTPEVITGGFGSRLLTVTATRPKRIIPWPEERENEQGFLERAERLLRGWKCPPPSPSAGLQGQPTPVGTLNSTNNPEKVTMPQPSPVDNQTTYSNSLAFCRSIEALRSLTETISSQLDALSTCARGREHQCLAILKGQEQELALMSLSLASLIYNASSNGEAQTGSPKPLSFNTSLTGSTRGD
jgi:hypothetical protein